MTLKKLPMIITWTRVILIPVFLVIYYLPYEHAHFTAMIVFGLAAITDWLDGYIARRYNASTPFGAFLDPVADKLIVIAALVVVAIEYQHWIITASALIIIMREVTVSALREWMAQRQLSDVIAVSNTGKYKTTFQLFALGMLVYGGQLFGVPWTEFGFILLILATFLTVLSLWQYSKAAWPTIKESF